MFYYLATTDLQTLRDAVAAADAAVFRLINHGLAASWLDPVVLGITWLGVGYIQAAIGLVLAAGGYANKDARLKRIGYTALLAYAGTGIFSEVIKRLCDRPRPVLVLFDVRLPYGPLWVHSFPSGHSMTAFAAAFVYAAFFPRSRWALFGLASLVALSRVYLGVHFPLDVLYGGFAGALIGIASARIISRIAPSPQPSPPGEGDRGPLPSPSPQKGGEESPR